MESWTSSESTSESEDVSGSTMRMKAAAWYSEDELLRRWHSEDEGGGTVMSSAGPKERRSAVIGRS